MGMNCEWDAAASVCSCPRPEVEGCPPFYMAVGIRPSGQFDCRRIGGGDLCPPGSAITAIDIDKSECMAIPDLTTNYTYNWESTSGACVGGFLTMTSLNCREVETNRLVDTKLCPVATTPTGAACTPPAGCAAGQLLTWARMLGDKCHVGC